MTYAEFYSAIKEGNISDEVVAFATKKLESIQAHADATQAEKAELQNKVRDALATTEKATAAEIAGAVGLSTQKVVSLLKPMMEDGTVIYTTEKVTGRGQVRMYSLAPKGEVV